MGVMYSVQEYRFYQGQWVGNADVVWQRAETPRSAAEMVMDCALIEDGRIQNVAVKVWEKGKAKHPSDVHHFWRQG